MWLFSESPEMGLSSGTGTIIIAPSVLALQALESDHLETLQARPDFTAFSRKHGSSFNSLHSYYRLLTITIHPWTNLLICVGVYIVYMIVLVLSCATGTVVARATHIFPNDAAGLLVEIVL